MSVDQVSSCQLNYLNYDFLLKLKCEISNLNIENLQYTPENSLPNKSNIFANEKTTILKIVFLNNTQM